MCLPCSRNVMVFSCLGPLIIGGSKSKHLSRVILFVVGIVLIKFETAASTNFSETFFVSLKPLTTSKFLLLPTNSEFVLLLLTFDERKPGLGACVTERGVACCKSF